MDCGGNAKKGHMVAEDAKFSVPAIMFARTFPSSRNAVRGPLIMFARERRMFADFWLAEIFLRENKFARTYCNSREQIPRTANEGGSPENTCVGNASGPITRSKKPHSAPDTSSFRTQALLRSLVAEHAAGKAAKILTSLGIHDANDPAIQQRLIDLHPNKSIPLDPNIPAPEPPFEDFDP